MDESLLVFESLLEPPEHRIECVRQLFEFVVGSEHPDPASKIGRLDLAGHLGDTSDWHQHSPGGEPADAETDDEHRTETDDRITPGAFRARVDRPAAQSFAGPRTRPVLYRRRPGRARPALPARPPARRGFATGPSRCHRSRSTRPRTATRNRAGSDEIAPSACEGRQRKASSGRCACRQPQQRDRRRRGVRRVGHVAPVSTRR